MPTDDQSLARLVNQNKQYEGGGITPAPQGGRRVPTVNNLQILRNQSIIGGAKITLAWLEENIDLNDYFEISVFAGTDFSKFTSDQASLDSLANTTHLYQAPIRISQSPAEITILASTRLAVTITVATRHSSGVLSSPGFQPFVTANIQPLAKYISTQTASFTPDSINSAVYLVDTSAGTVTVTLPLIDTVVDGLALKFKKTTAANNLTLQGAAAAETIDGAATFTLATQYTVMHVLADKTAKVWWIMQYAV